MVSHGKTLARPFRLEGRPFDRMEEAPDTPLMDGTTSMRHRKHGQDATKRNEEDEKEGSVDVEGREKVSRTVHVAGDPWFRGWCGLDLRSVAFLRALLAFLLLVDLGMRARNFKEINCDDYLAPTGYSPHGWIVHRVLFYRGGVLLQSAIAAFQTIVLLAFLVGYRTNVTSVLAWLLTTMMHGRNEWVNNAGDKIAITFLFWLMFLPCGEYFAYNKGALNRPAVKYASFATLCYRMQIVYLYLSPMYLRWSSPMADTWTWAKANAVYYTVHYTTATPFGMNVVGQYPGLCKVLTRFAIMFETVGAVLLAFCPSQLLQLILVIGFVKLHMGIALVAELGIFPFISSISAFGLIPSLTWDSKMFARALQSQPGKFLAKMGSSTGNVFEACFGKPASGHRRSKLSALLERWLAVFFMVYFFILVLGNVGLLKHPDEGNIAEALRVTQRWPMYSPNAPSSSAWVIVEGKLQNKTYIDLMEVWRHGWESSQRDWVHSNWRPATINLDRPMPTPHAIFPNVRMSKFMTHNMHPEEDPKRGRLLTRQFVRYMCRQWDEKMKPGTGDVPRLLTTLTHPLRTGECMYESIFKALGPVTQCGLDQ
eukprot:scaffold2848_cov352-Pavlova_lutheri.AAC.56